MAIRVFSLLLPALLLSVMAIQGVALAAAPAAGPAGLMGGSPDLPGNFFNSAHRVATSPLKQEWAYIPIGRDRLRTFVVYPAGDAQAPVVLVQHYDSGLDSMQQALAVQLAYHGFVAVAPDLLSGLGPDRGNYDSFRFPDAALRAVLAVGPTEAMRRYKVAYDYAKTLPRGNGKIAALGMGLGGTHSFRLAAEIPDLSAAVVFYGSPPDQRALARINAPVLGLYGGDDPEIVPTVQPTAAAMKQLGKVYEPHVYPGATRFFMSYVVEARNGEAVTAAWPAAITFLNQHTR